MTKKKEITPIYTPIKLVFVLKSSIKEIIKVFPVPYVFDFNYYKKFKL